MTCDGSVRKGASPLDSLGSLEIIHYTRSPIPHTRQEEEEAMANNSFDLISEMAVLLENKMKDSNF